MYAEVFKVCCNVAKQNRRIEIEGLDLAVERQKTFFKDLKEEENSILAKREAIKREFESLQRGRVERRNFQYDNKNNACSK